MDFSKALEALKEGNFIKRESMGNNVIYMTEIERTEKNKKLNTENVKTTNQILNMNTISRDSTSHQFSSVDMLAEDWIVVENPLAEKVVETKSTRKKK